MDGSRTSMAYQIAQAARAFQQEQTQRRPKSVSVVMSDDTLVITLHEALSEAEKAVAQSPEGAQQLQEFHRQLFESAADNLRADIERITGVKISKAAAEIEPTTGMVIKVFTTGTVVQVFLLADNVETDAWSNRERPEDE